MIPRREAEFTLALTVYSAEVGLSVGETLVGSHPVPSHGF